MSAALSPVEAYANRDTEDSVMPGYVRPANTLGDSFGVLKLTGEGISVSSFKRNDKTGNLIVRLRNRTDSEVDGELEITLPGFRAKDVYFVNFEEIRQNKAGEGNNISLKIPAHKLVTLEFVI